MYEENLQHVRSFAEVLTWHFATSKVHKDGKLILILIAELT